MDTELLRTFLEVRTTRHFGRAAQNLCITQAAVSARIKQLEEMLGVSLFSRDRNNIRTSPEGERLVPHAEAVLQTLALARRDVTAEDGQARRIQLGIRSGIWGVALQQRLAVLQEAEQDLTFQTQVLEPEEIISKLLDRSLDMAILYETNGLEEFRSVPIGELKLRLYHPTQEPPEFYRQLHLVSSLAAGDEEIFERVVKYFVPVEE